MTGQYIGETRLDAYSKPTNTPGVCVVDTELMLADISACFQFAGKTKEEFLTEAASIWDQASVLTREIIRKRQQ